MILPADGHIEVELREVSLFYVDGEKEENEEKEAANSEKNEFTVFEKYLKRCVFFMMTWQYVFFHSVGMSVL